MPGRSAMFAWMAAAGTFLACGRPTGGTGSASMGLQGAPEAREPWCLVLPKGRGPGQVGLHVPREGAPEAPMAFVVDGQGHVILLDQVNERVQLLDGEGTLLKAWPLPSPTFQDLALLPKGGMVVLDRLAARRLLFLDEDGAVVSGLPVEGPYVPEGGGVTGLFVTREGVWLEVEHRASVLVAKPEGRPVPRRRVFGRPLHGRVLRARLLADGRIQVTLGQMWGAAPARRLALLPESGRVREVVALEACGRGRILLAAKRPAVEGLEELLVWVLDLEGRLVGRRVLELQPTALEVFRPLRCDERGRVFLLTADEEAASLEEVWP